MNIIAASISKYRNLLLPIGIAVGVGFFVYFRWEYQNQLRERSNEKIEYMHLLADALRAKMREVLANGSFRGLEDVFGEIRQKAKKCHIEIELYDEIGIPAFSDFHKVDRVADKVEKDPGAFLGLIPLSIIKEDIEHVRTRKRPRSITFPMPERYKKHFAEALAKGRSELPWDIEDVKIFECIDRSEAICAVCHEGEDAIIVTTVHIDEMGAELRRKLGLENLFRFLVFAIGLTAFWIVGKMNEMYKLEREQERLLFREQERRKELRDYTDKLEESRLSVQLIVDNTVDGIITIDKKGIIESFNPAAHRIFGYRPEEIIGENVTSLIPDKYIQDHQKGLEHYNQTNEPRIIGKTIVIEGKRKNGEIFPMELSLNEMRSGDHVRFQGLVRDITERKLSEDNLESAYKKLGDTQKASVNIMGDLVRHRKELDASLKEKEVLLSEIHHRVKNNMQVISSLLKLQSRKIEDKKLKDMFKDSESRIKSMALVHERLYRTEDLAHIDFRDYLKGLARGIFRSFGSKAGKIALSLNVENVSLGIDAAIPCGLIINELIVNSLKHAFPGDRKGELNIIMRSEECGMGNGDLKSALRTPHSAIELVVRDNGVGFPKDLDYRNTESLGLHLVTKLVKQLRGEIELKGEKGTEWRIRFAG